MKICAIHQPNFIPWLPYFDKISKADIFIFLDNVAYPKSGSSMGAWCNRVAIDMQGRDLWFSCPVIRESGTQLIKTVKINYRQVNFEKWIYTLQCAYAKHSNLRIITQIITEVFNENHLFVADFNISLIKKICKLIDINTFFTKQSELGADSFSSNEMLINLCHKVNASHYLSGTGAISYMDDEKFLESGIHVLHQKQNYTESINLVKKYSIIHHLITTNISNWGQFDA